MEAGSMCTGSIISICLLVLHLLFFAIYNFLLIKASVLHPVSVRSLALLSLVQLPADRKQKVSVHWSVTALAHSLTPRVT